MFGAKDPYGKFARWALLVAGMDATVVYKKGSEMGGVDGLTRLVNSIEVHPEEKLQRLLQQVYKIGAVQIVEREQPRAAVTRSQLVSPVASNPTSSLGSGRIVIMMTT